MIDPFLLFIGLVVFVAGVSTGMTGLGFAQLTATSLGLLIDPKTAVLVLSITVPAVSGLQILRNRRQALPTRRLLPLLIGALAGVPIGVILLTILPSDLIAGFLGSVTLLFVLTRLAKYRPTLSPAREPYVMPAFGVAAGIFNGTVGVSGPVLVPLLLSLKLPAATFAYTVSVLFVAMTLVRLTGIVLSGTMSPDTFLLGLALLVPAVTGQRVGFILQRWVPERVFEWIVLALLALGGVVLLARAAGV